MKFNWIISLSLVATLFACEDQPVEETKTEEPKVDSTSLVPQEQPQANPVVVQIGAFKKSKNAASRAGQISGATIVEEGNLKKVLVTAQSEDEVTQIKDQLSGQDQPFKRLDK